MYMKFTKMQGTGNDYIYVYGEEGRDFSALAQALSPRQKAVGSDGLIHVKPGSQGDFVMEMYNADGSQGAMCGNGIRCLGKYVYDMGHTQKTELMIETQGGHRHLKLHLGEDGKVAEVTVAMGNAIDRKDMVLSVEGKAVEGTYVSMGNPHFVLMCQEPRHINLEILGPALEKHPAFAPDGVNVEFYTPTEEGFYMRVWERGSGETLACGTGACACFAVGQEKGVLDQGGLTAELPGGRLQLWQEEGEIFLQGEAVTVFHGEVEIE